jgi:hypothetical protein
LRGLSACGSIDLGRDATPLVSRDLDRRALGRAPMSTAAE